MNQSKTLFSALLALLMLCMPALAGAQELADTHGALQQEALSSGLAVTHTYTFAAPTLPFNAETTESIQLALSRLRLEHTEFDDIDATYDLYTLFAEETPVLSAQTKVTEEEVLLMTSLLPDKVLSMPTTEADRLGSLFLPISPFQLFTLYLPNLPGGFLSLTEEEATYLDSALTMYLYRIGAWVSATQRERGNLYENIFDGLPGSDARDAAAIGFESHMSAVDLKALFRLVADGFYEDVEMYPVLAHYLSAFGVTEQDVYDFSRYVPQELLSNDDAKGITPLPDAELLFGRYDAENGDLVGLEVDLPQMYEELPFSFLLDYGAKREAEGLRGEGYVEFALNGQHWAGDASLWEGDVADEMQSTLYSLEAQTDADIPARIRAYAQEEARILEDHTAQSEARAHLDYTGSNDEERLSVDITANQETGHTEEDGLAGASAYALFVSGNMFDKEGTLELEVREEMHTASYTVPTFAGETIAPRRMPEADLKTFLQTEALPQALAAGYQLISPLSDSATTWLLTGIGKLFTFLQW